MIVELPGVNDQQRALELVGQTAELRFRPVLATLPPGDQTPTPETTTTTAAPARRRPPSPARRRPPRPAETTTTSPAGRPPPSRATTTTTVAGDDDDDRRPGDDDHDDDPDDHHAHAPARRTRRRRRSCWPSSTRTATSRPLPARADRPARQRRSRGADAEFNNVRVDDAASSSTSEGIHGLRRGGRRSASTGEPTCPTGALGDRARRRGASGPDHPGRPPFERRPPSRSRGELQRGRGQGPRARAALRRAAGAARAAADRADGVGHARQGLAAGRAHRRRHRPSWCCST